MKNGLWNLRYSAALCSGLAASICVPQSARANPPDLDSLQANRMADYSDFITLMHLPGAPHGCCNQSDGRMGEINNKDIQETTVKDANGGWHYRIHIMPNVFGKDSRNPALPDSPEKHSYDVLLGTEGKWFDVPNDHILTDAGALSHCPPKSETCAMPSANIAWLSTGGEIYCYWPRHFLGQLEPSEPKVRFGSLQPSALFLN